MHGNLLFWVLFNAFVLAMLVLDLGVFHRKAHVVKFQEALYWTAAWITLALTFGALIFFFGHQMTGNFQKPNSELTLEFLVGYVIELSLSVDNLFVFLLIFRYFKVPRVDQHKVLFWGILGALIMRAIFIALGVTLIRRFHWVIYIFGAFLVYTGYKLLRQAHVEVHPESNPVVNLFRKMFPVTRDYEGDRFFVRKHGRALYATPLAIVLVVVETTDVVFAVDSIPAILAITTDPFIVYTSNVFAILGLRSMFFALAGMMEMFHHLHYGLAVILMFVGMKMLASEFFKLPTWVALGVVVLVLALSVVASVLTPHKRKELAEADSE